MNTKMLVKVRSMFCSDEVDPKTARHNCRAWVRSVRMLGDRWLLAKTFKSQELKGEYR